MLNTFRMIIFFFTSKQFINVLHDTLPQLFLEILGRKIAGKA